MVKLTFIHSSSTTGASVPGETWSTMPMRLNTLLKRVLQRPCGGCYPWIPTWRPNTLTRIGVGRADQVQTVLIRTTCCARLQEASSSVGIGSNLPCIARDTVVTD